MRDSVVRGIDRVDPFKDFHHGLLSPADHAALAWSYLAKGHEQQESAYFTLAARAYRDLLERPIPVPGSSDQEHAKAVQQGVRQLLLSASARCFQFTDDLEEAKRLVLVWLNEYPTTPGVAERLAEIEAKKGDYQAAFEALSKEIGTNPRYEHDWKATLLIELGTRPTNSVTVSDRFASIIGKDDRYRALGEAVTTHHWPTFSQLSDEAKSHWLAGLLLLHEADYRTQLRDSVWHNATYSFGMALEKELRGRIFDKFATDTQSAAAQWNTPERSPGKGDKLARFVRTGQPKPTLGLMVDWLELVHTPRARAHPTIGALHSWLIRKNKKLVTDRIDFKRLRSHIVEKRNDAVHAQISEQGARDLCREAQRLLKALLPG